MDSSLTRIGLLRMDDLPDHGLHVRGNYPDLYAHLFRDLPVELLDIPVHLGATPASLDDADVWLLTGSRHSVYDDLGWVATAHELTRALIADERATVGICFGHQLFGHALGGSVQAAGTWGVGAHTYETVAPLRWLPDPQAPVTLIASHRDQVVTAPPDATVWSTSDFCPVAGMIVGARAWSVQGHPEFTGDVAHALYDGRRTLIGDDAVDAAQRSLVAVLSNTAIATAIVATAWRPQRRS